MLAAAYLRHLAASPWARFADQPPWRITQDSDALVAAIAAEQASDTDWQVADGIAVHRSATVESGAVLRIGANAVVAPGALMPPGSVLPRLALLDQEAAP